eukprot:TRINITY_DN2332_c0_g1_i4.p1 TRINITY_DN2332_c0_g1~~TRINITY_DN2332_c0_g1_i4.p1  ORF type:complete len:254 (-),score=48.36 TRINITY_DN2332_c0_g1_i4:211-972(-)
MQIFKSLAVVVVVVIGFTFAAPNDNENCKASITQYQHQAYNDGTHDYSIYDVNVYSQGVHTISNLTLRVAPPTNYPIVKTWGINLENQGESSFTLPSFTSIKIGSMYNFGYLITGKEPAVISIHDITCRLPSEKKSCNVSFAPLQPVEIRNNEDDEESVYLLYNLNFTNSGENSVSKVFFQVSFPDLSALDRYFGMEKTCCTQIKSEATFEVDTSLEKDESYDDMGFILHFTTRHSKFDTHPVIHITGIECEN